MNLPDKEKISVEKFYKTANQINSVINSCFSSFYENVTQGWNVFLGFFLILFSSFFLILFSSFFLFTSMELSLCHKFWFSNPYIVATRCVDLRYFKLWIFSDQIILVWNIKSLHYQVAKIYELENMSLSQRLNSFIRSNFLQGTT